MGGVSFLGGIWIVERDSRDLGGRAGRISGLEFHFLRRKFVIRFVFLRIFAGLLCSILLRVSVRVEDAG